jgi:hypothetical protein
VGYTNRRRPMIAAKSSTLEPDHLLDSVGLYYSDSTWCV